MKRENEKERKKLNYLNGRKILLIKIGSSTNLRFSQTALYIIPILPINKMKFQPISKVPSPYFADSFIRNRLPHTIIRHQERENSESQKPNHQTEHNHQVNKQQSVKPAARADQPQQ